MFFFIAFSAVSNEIINTSRCVNAEPDATFRTIACFHFIVFLSDTSRIHAFATLYTEEKNKEGRDIYTKKSKHVCRRFLWKLSGKQKRIALHKRIAVKLLVIIASLYAYFRR